MVSTHAIQYINKQEAFVASINSTVDGFREPFCIRTNNSEELVKKLLDYLLEISAEAYTQELARMEPIFDELDEKIVENTVAEEETDDKEIKEYHQWEAVQMESLKEKLDTQIHQHTVYSFNGECP